MTTQRDGLQEEYGHKPPQNSFTTAGIQKSLNTQPKARTWTSCLLRPSRRKDSSRSNFTTASIQKSLVRRARNPCPRSPKVARSPAETFTKASPKTFSMSIHTKVVLPVGGCPCSQARRQPSLGNGFWAPAGRLASLCALPVGLHSPEVLVGPEPIQDTNWTSRITSQPHRAALAMLQYKSLSLPYPKLFTMSFHFHHHYLPRANHPD